MLLVAYLERPNYAPRAVIKAILALTVMAELVLTGPSLFLMNFLYFR